MKVLVSHNKSKLHLNIYPTSCASSSRTFPAFCWGVMIRRSEEIDKDNKTYLLNNYSR